MALSTFFRNRNPISKIFCSLRQTSSYERKKLSATDNRAFLPSLIGCWRSLHSFQEGVTAATSRQTDRNIFFHLMRRPVNKTGKIG
ncbi:hypothetical protein EAJ17_09010 [Akkermansia sp. aa_0143]|nr:hypothetical protein EAJ17_09010 [Akkermansia sp. aa_0143]